MLIGSGGAYAKKRALDIPPDLAQRAFFFNHLAWILFVELPPGCSFEAGDPALGGRSSREADLAENKIKLPENQENGRNLSTRFRPVGPKSGHRWAFLRF